MALVTAMSDAAYAIIRDRVRTESFQQSTESVELPGQLRLLGMVDTNVDIPFNILDGRKESIDEILNLIKRALFEKASAQFEHRIDYIFDLRFKLSGESDHYPATSRKFWAVGNAYNNGCI